MKIRQPDDWHCHLRDGQYLSRTVPDQAKQFARTMVMPNLSKPITTIKQATDYYQRIIKYVPPGEDFSPLMTLYLTSSTTVDVIKAAKETECIYACKLYPAHATTNAAAGVLNLKTLYPVLAAMEAQDLPLLLHGESIEPGIDIFDRESFFIEKQLKPLIHDFPELRVVLEHISTKHAVEFIKSAPKKVASTITPHHLRYDRNDLLRGGLHPHYYCLPILQRRGDCEALRKAATSGNPKFFLGTDSAPHARKQKESTCGCAGIYSAHAAMEFYTSIFEEEGALDKLESFASIHGAQFYQIPLNRHMITLKKEKWTIPGTLNFGDTQLIPLGARETLNWKIQANG